MNIEYPEVINEMKAMQTIFNEEETCGKILEKNIECLEKDIHLNSQTERGIKRRESILGIIPQETETLQDRRVAIICKWYDKPPYTISYLRKRLDDLCKNYTIEINKETMVMKIRLYIEIHNQFLKIMEMIENIVPLNVIIDLDVMYNNYLRLESYPYIILSMFTYKELHDINLAENLSNKVDDIKNYSVDFLANFTVDEINNFGLRIGGEE